MTNYYNNSIEYNNDLDAFEARVRAEQAETEYEIGRRIMRQIIADENKAKDCPFCNGAGYKRISPTILATCDHSEPEGSDNRMSTQIREYLDS
jgi:hypothetical protein